MPDAWKFFPMFMAFFFLFPLVSFASTEPSSLPVFRRQYTLIEPLSERESFDAAEESDVNYQIDRLAELTLANIPIPILARSYAVPVTDSFKRDAKATEHASVADFISWFEEQIQPQGASAIPSTPVTVQGDHAVAPMSIQVATDTTNSQDDAVTEGAPALEAAVLEVLDVPTAAADAAPKVEQGQDREEGPIYYEKDGIITPVLHSPPTQDVQNDLLYEDLPGFLPHMPILALALVVFIFFLI